MSLRYNVSTQEERSGSIGTPPSHRARTQQKVTTA